MRYGLLVFLTSYSLYLSSQIDSNAVFKLSVGSGYGFSSLLKDSEYNLQPINFSSLILDLQRERNPAFCSARFFIRSYNVNLEDLVTTYSYIDAGFPPNSDEWEGYRWEYEAQAFSVGCSGVVNTRLTKLRSRFGVYLGGLLSLEKMLFKVVQTDEYTVFDYYRSFNSGGQTTYTSNKEWQYSATDKLGLRKNHLGISLDAYFKMQYRINSYHSVGMEFGAGRYLRSVFGRIDDYTIQRSAQLSFWWLVSLHR